jgi:hypothetical protein
MVFFSGISTPFRFFGALNVYDGSWRACPAWRWRRPNDLPLSRTTASLVHVDAWLTGLFSRLANFLERLIGLGLNESPHSSYLYGKATLD